MTVPLAMAGLAVTRDEHGVAVLKLDNPPVNALSSDLRHAIHACLQGLAADPTVLAVVLAGAGRGFSAGADIRDLAGAAKPPTLPELVASLEQYPKPLIAALHGHVLGGGLELALGTHYRIAAPRSRMGLPEIKLGLIPGAGATQRLPRLIGMQPALQLIMGGETVDAARALELGLVDEIDAEPEAAARNFAAALAGSDHANHRKLRRVSELPPGRDARASLDAAAAALNTRKPALPAPVKVIEALRAAVDLPFDAGMQIERSAFLALKDSPESKALRHAFTAERDAGRLPAALSQVPIRPIGSAVVVGAGTMGQGIALVLAEAGIEVRLHDADEAVISRALAALDGIGRSRVARGKLSAPAAAAIRTRIRPIARLEEAGDADLAIEAVFEDLEVKREVLQRLGRIIKPGAVIATNTSYLDVDALADASGRAGDVIGLHFFSPAHVMRLLEVVPGARTDPSVQATALGLGRRLGKQAVLVGNARGFVGNRMMARRTREAYFLLEEGATPWQIDTAFTDFGFAMGPFAVGDLSGLDIGWRNRRAQFEHLTARERQCTILDELIEAGRLGQKTGRGFYRYDEERRGLPDPQVEALIERHSRAMGRARRNFDAGEILQRCLLAMIDEGARILEEGRARSPSDIDVVWLHGYGFPRHRGGPLFHADQVGLSTVRDCMLRYRAQQGAEYWEVAPLLERLAASGGSFESWASAGRDAVTT